MGGHEELVDEIIERIERCNRRPISAIMRMKNAPISIQQTLIKRQQWKNSAGEFLALAMIKNDMLSSLKKLFMQFRW